MSRKSQILILTLLLAAPLVVPEHFALAAGPGGLGGPAGAPTGPIDITANEQEFAGDQVIAKGNVHVKYKDSVVIAPVAQLFRDPGGNPQRAVFTGHPRLTQGNNKIDAEMLIFEMASSKIVAQGRAHSEVVSEGGSKPPAPAAPTDPSLATASPESPDGAEPAAAAVKQAAVNSPKEPPEKIVTDSDRQEYDRATGKFEATGHVRVVHGNILVKADKLTLVYGVDNKPETALFIGNVTATQDRNNTSADTMTYSLSTKRLQATGHVKSTVIQERKDDKKKPAAVGQNVDPAGMQAAVATEIDQPKDDIVVITSDSQDYSKQTGRMTATGGVRVYYQDTTGAGPQCVLIRNMQGKCERVVFSGRSQISQPGRRWIADRIEMTIADKKVLASGNTKALILQTPKNPGSQSQLANQGRSTSSLASSTNKPKVETPQ